MYRVVFSLLIFTLAAGGCATMGVQPWDRDLMAEPEMQLNPYPIETAFEDKVYFSRESSSGGRGFAGGGCGCN